MRTHGVRPSWLYAADRGDRGRCLLGLRLLQSKPRPHPPRGFTTPLRICALRPLVIVNTAAANRDPAVYDEPDRLDITREAPPAMLTFGGGAHYCLGANLARLELAEALTVLTRRMPNPRRTGPAPWKSLGGVTGPTALPIEFDAGH